MDLGSEQEASGYGLQDVLFNENETYINSTIEVKNSTSVTIIISDFNIQKKNTFKCQFYQKFQMKKHNCHKMDNKKQKNVGGGDRMNTQGPSNQHAKNY